jgi:hypothetical protein
MSFTIEKGMPFTIEKGMYQNGDTLEDIEKKKKKEKKKEICV